MGLHVAALAPRKILQLPMEPAEDELVPDERADARQGLPACGEHCLTNLAEKLLRSTNRPQEPRIRLHDDYPVLDDFCVSHTR